MAGRQQSTRTLRATKNQVANQLQLIRPGITGAQIISIRQSDDATFWQAQITSGYAPFGAIEQKIDTFVEFDNDFIVTNLLAQIDASIRPNDILQIKISEEDATKVEVILKRR